MRETRVRHPARPAKIIALSVNLHSEMRMQNTARSSTHASSTREHHDHRLRCAWLQSMSAALQRTARGEKSELTRSTRRLAAGLIGAPKRLR